MYHIINNAFNIPKKPKHNGYQRALASTIYIIFDKKALGGTAKSGIMPNQQLAEELDKPIIRKFEKGKVHPCFMDNIWGADLANMHLINKPNKGFQLWLCLIDIHSFIIHMMRGLFL